MLPIIAGIISSLLSNNLPKLAQAVVEKGLDYVEEKTGIKLEPDMSPEKIAELRLAAQKHEEFRMEMEFKNKELEQKNTADARDLQKVALNQDDVWSKRFVYIFASFWSVCAAIYIGMITFGSIPLGNERFADTILGFILGTVISTIINYFFGSSSGSAMKTQIMKDKLPDESK